MVTNPSNARRRLATLALHLFLAAALLIAVPQAGLTQSRDGYTLDEAVAAARQSAGDKVTRARTKRSNGREIHEIRVLTKGGVVRELRFKGKRIDKKER